MFLMFFIIRNVLYVFPLGVFLLFPGIGCRFLILLFNYLSPIPFLLFIALHPTIIIAKTPMIHGSPTGEGPFGPSGPLINPFLIAPGLFFCSAGAVALAAGELADGAALLNGIYTFPSYRETGGTICWLRKAGAGNWTDELSCH